MSTYRILVTGATGFVGGHVAEACAAKGWPVVALARDGSDTSVLDRVGATIVRGDITDNAAVQRALADVDAVVHCAAKVGDWGPVGEYRAVNVDALRRMLEAVRERSRPLHRFVHISSLGVYAFRHHHGTTEDDPLPAQHMDGYTQSKVEAEAVVTEFHRQFKLPTVTLRPGFIYGERDRTVLPKLIDILERRAMRYVGPKGDQLLNTTYVGNLAAAVLLAIEKSEAIGRTYNITDGEAVSRRRFYETVADGLGLPRPATWTRWPVVSTIARVVEGLARLRGAKQAPWLTRGKLKFLGLNLDFSIERARRELGYAPPVSFDEAMRRSLEWFRTQKKPT